MKHVLLVLLALLFQPNFAHAQSKKEYKLTLTPEQKAKVDEMLKREAEAAQKTDEHEYKLTPDEKRKVDKLLKEQPEEEVVREDGKAVPKKEQATPPVADNNRESKFIIGGGIGYGFTDYKADYILDDLADRAFVSLRPAWALNLNSSIGLVINYSGRSKEYYQENLTVSFTQLLADYTHYFNSYMNGFYTGARMGVTTVTQTIDPDYADDTNKTDTDFAVGIAPGYIIQLASKVGLGLEVDYTHSFGSRSYPTVIGMTYFRAWF